MDRLRRTSMSLATPPVTPSKADAPKLRRKLQKISKHSRNQPTQQSGSVTSTETLDKNSRHANKPDVSGPPRVVSQLLLHNSAPGKGQQRPCLPPPDLSDAKWVEYLRRSGVIYALDGSPAASNTHSMPVKVIPELAHLKHEAAKPQPKEEKMAPPMLLANPSTATVAKRRAKTPILRIGQLEGFPQHQMIPPSTPIQREHREPKPQMQPRHVPQPTGPNQSVELLAEQYRALLKPSSDSLFVDANLAQPKQEHPAQERYVEIRRNSADELHVSSSGMSPANCSPISDTTVVAFDDETVYFKPISFSPEPPSPSSVQQGDVSPALSSDWSPPDNISLQICLDLLAKELQSATTDRSRRVGADVSALQIWVMIESYERLRERLVGGDGLRMLDCQRGAVELMLDMWLRALYTMHDSLVGEGRSVSSESDYDNLESPALD